VVKANNLNIDLNKRICDRNEKIMREEGKWWS
jgi:hypothetical protein